jgi:hypothetical protein
MRSLGKTVEIAAQNVILDIFRALDLGLEALHRLAIVASPIIREKASYSRWRLETTIGQPV